MNKQERDELRVLVALINTLADRNVRPMIDLFKVIDSVPALLDEVERLEAENALLRKVGLSLAESLDTEGVTPNEGITTFLRGGDLEVFKQSEAWVSCGFYKDMEATNDD